MNNQNAVEGDALMNAIMDSSLDAIVLVDSKGILVEFNKGAEIVFGYKREDVIGKMMQDYLIPESLRKFHEEGFEKFLETGKGSIIGRRVELMGLRSNGTEFPIDISMSPVDTGSEVYIAGFIRDITEKKKFEEDLLKSEHRYRVLYNETPVMLHTVDNQGNIISVNDYWIDVFGYKREEALKLNLIDLYSPQEKKIGEKNFEELKQEGQIRDRQVSLLKKNSEIIQVLLSANTDTDEFSNVSIYHGVMRDITEQLAAEEALIEKSKQLVQKVELEKVNNELQRANKELREFAHVVSHDLKAPLRGIGNITDWLQTDYREKFDQKGRNNLDLLISRAKWMERLIEDILQYSKVGMKDNLKDHLDLNEVLEQCVKMIDKPENCSIVVENALPEVYGIRSNWQQLFQNLIGNAIEHNDKEAIEIKIGSRENIEEYLFWVKDNGPGIDDKHRERIFRIFQTLRDKYAFNRTGIGLSIVKKVVELTKGKIWFESDIGKGTTFYFTYPTTEEEL